MSDTKRKTVSQIIKPPSPAAAFSWFETQEVVDWVCASASITGLDEFILRSPQGSGSHHAAVAKRQPLRFEVNKRPHWALTLFLGRMQR
jgi:hypothetical protein